jgi:hypothetical protein
MFRTLPPLVGVPLKFGIAGSVLIIILFVFLFYAGKHPLLISIVTDFRLILIPLFVFMSIKEYRDYRNNQVLHFWQGLIIGFNCYFVIGSLTAILILIFPNFEPEFLNKYIDISTNQLINNKEQVISAVGENAYNRTLQKMPLTTSIDLALDYAMKTLLIGIPITIIISVLLRRQPKL